jgi:hypothetical protein
VTTFYSIVCGTGAAAYRISSQELNNGALGSHQETVGGSIVRRHKLGLPVPGPDSDLELIAVKGGIALLELGDRFGVVNVGDRDLKCRC